MIIKRQIFNKLLSELTKPEVSLLIGPRQVGKTFLLNQLNNYCLKNKIASRFFNLEDPNDMYFFSQDELAIFNQLSKLKQVIFIDEFHYYKNASKLFKALYDSGKGIKIYASGSSSIEIHKHLKESLAGRRIVTELSPLCYEEVSPLNYTLEQYLIWGGLPGVYLQQEEIEKMNVLSDIIKTYILKDIKSLLREEDIIAFNNLLFILCDRQGSLISHASLANELRLHFKILNKHLQVLEQTFLCFPLSSYSTNLANELKKSKKYYFFDLGIRNAVLRDFSKIELRRDKGAIYETFIYLNLKRTLKPNESLHFWRTKQGHEVDFIKLINRKPTLIEVKADLNQSTIPKGIIAFIKRYPDTQQAYILNNKIVYDTHFQNTPIYFRRFDSQKILI